MTCPTVIRVTTGTEPMTCPTVIRVTTGTGPPGIGLPAGVADAGKYVRKVGATPYAYELADVSTLSDSAPQALGAAAAGTATAASRGDHQHAMPTAAEVGAATAAQGAKADTAVQPSGLSPYLTKADNLASLESADTARTNIGAARFGSISGSGLTVSGLVLAGRYLTGVGGLQEISLGSGLSFTGSVLNGFDRTAPGAIGGTTPASGAFTNLTLSARFACSVNGAASAPPLSLTGTWFSGGTSTTTKPQYLIEPAGTTSTAWSTAGTGLGVNAPSGFTGDYIALCANGTLFASLGSNSGSTSYGGMLKLSNSNYQTSTAYAIWGNSDSGLSIGSMGWDNTNNAVSIASFLGNNVFFGNNQTSGEFYLNCTSANNAASRAVLVVRGCEVTSRALPGGDLILRGGNAIGSTLTNADGGNVTLTGGNKKGTGLEGKITIGTLADSRIGFYGASPVVRPAAVANATDAASAITQLNALLANLRTLGLITT